MRPARPLGSLRRPAAAVSLAAGLALGAPALQAQVVVEGATRSFQTDVTGPAVTSGDLAAGLFGPGSVKILSCPASWGVRTTAATTAAELAAGTLLVAAPEPAGAPLPPDVQQRLHLLLTTGDAAAAAAVSAALAPSVNARARRAARELVGWLDGLLASGATLHPARPDWRRTQQLGGAAAAFNRFVDQSTPAFLSAPPADFSGIQAVLSRLVIAAIENDPRTDFVVAPGDADRTTPPELICAPPQPPEPPVVPPPPPPPEHAIVVCVLVDDLFVNVPAVFVPATGDTLALVGGRRMPFSEAYPDTVAYLREQAWTVEADEIVIGATRYTRFGLPFVARPGDASIVGEYRGVPVFAARAERPPYRSLFLLSGRRCELQEYREAREVRRVRG